MFFIEKKSMMMKRKIVVLGMGLLLALAGFANASLMVETTGAGTIQGAGPFFAGVAFTVDEAVTVTHLGKFDIDGGGITEDQLVALYNFDNGALLTSATVETGTAAQESGFYDSYFADIADYTLNPGTIYVLAAQVRAGDMAYDVPVTWAFGNFIAGVATNFDYNMPATATTATFSIINSNTAYYGANVKFDSGSITPRTLFVTAPKTRAVFQRDSHGIAIVPVEGTYTDSPTQIEARVVVMDGFNGTALDWQVIDAAPTGDSFFATLPVAVGGWYSIEVRVFDGQAYSSTVSVDKVGVGEVFITAGQSNSANFGSPAMTPTYDTVSAWTGSSWRHAYDPQPIANGTGGSPWSRLGDIMAERFDCPIGFVSVGIGGTEIAPWVPGGSYYPRIQSAITSMGDNGMRAILWHQGESDSLASTSAATYASRLNSIIAQSRIDAGWDVPWGVALASYHPSSTSAQEAAVRAGQIQVIDGDPLVFQGADTDDFHNLGYLSDSVHFNATGLYQHALEWQRATLRHLFPCDCEPDGDVDLMDFAVFASYWLDTNCIDTSDCDESDLLDDDVINFEDLAICIDNWMN
jgi:hypothetical protein